MPSPVLYRKWRSRTLAEVVGQEAVTRTLHNAIAGNRVAHAYMFSGPRGTGKTSTARILAKAVNCQNPQAGEPCDRCSSCIAITEGSSLDVIEIDAASNRRIDDIRELREKVKYMAGDGRYKVYIVDEVHMLTTEAANALLKTLEEPPPHAIFVLATTDPQQVPVTILSRCQRLDFRRIPHLAMVDRLAYICEQEGVAVAAGGLDLIARTSGGGLRDALNSLEQLIVYYGQQIALEQVQHVLGLTGDPRAIELVEALIRGEVRDGLTLIAQVSEDGVDLRQFCREVVEFLRALVLMKAGAPEALDLPASERSVLEGLAPDARLDELTRAARAFSGIDFRQEHRSSLALELALLDVILTEQAAPARPTLPISEAQRGTRRAVSAPRDLPPAEAPQADGERQDAATLPAEPNGQPAMDTSDHMERVQRELKSISLENKLVQSMLRTYVTVEKVEDNTVYLGFRHEPNRSRMEESKNRQAAEAAISKALGGHWRIVCVSVKDPHPVGHLVRKAQELGFRVVEGATEEP